jgi:hypothetical protein
MSASLASFGERIAALEEEVAQLKEKKRDGWDKFATITSALIPLTIAAVGWWYSDSMKRTETEVAEIRAAADSRIKQAEVIAKFFDPLTDDTNVKRQNFAIDSVMVAAPDYGPILVKAVERAKVTTAQPGEASHERTALDKKRDALVPQLFSNDAKQRLRAYEQLMETWDDDAGLIPVLIEHALANKSNDNGIYNSLVLLGHMERETIQKHKADILEFVAKVEGGGPKIKERADKLRLRL